MKTCDQTELRIQLSLPAWDMGKIKLRLSAVPRTSHVVLGKPSGCQQRGLQGHQLKVHLLELGGWIR